MALGQQIQGVVGPLTDRSGTIAAGGVSQVVANANNDRAFLFFQNVSDTTMWINFGATANTDQPSIKVLPDATFVTDRFVPTSSVNVICATTGKAYTCKEG